MKILSIPKKVVLKGIELYGKEKTFLKNKKRAKNDKRNRIAFSGWFPATDEWKNNFIFNSFLPNRKNWTLNQYKPALEYFSVFGKREDIKKSKAKVKIFWTGEDVEKNFTSFADNCVTDATLSIGFTPLHKVLSSNYIRYPLWLLYYFGNLKNKDELKNAIDKFNEKQYTKTKFCSLVASHDSNGMRKKMYDLLNPICSVSSAGKIFHNDDSLVKDFNNNKQEYLKDFMFNICPENISIEGYTTEKIFQSFDSGCIPLYFGSNDTPEIEVINPKSFLLYNEKNDDEFFENVKTLYTNPNAYKDFMRKPRLLDTAVDYIFDLNAEVQKRFDAIDFRV